MNKLCKLLGVEGVNQDLMFEESWYNLHFWYKIIVLDYHNFDKLLLL